MSSRFRSSMLEYRVRSSISSISLVNRFILVSADQCMFPGVIEYLSFSDFCSKDLRISGVWVPVRVTANPEVIQRTASPFYCTTPNLPLHSKNLED